MTKVKDLHAEWMKDEEYRREYHALDSEFAPSANPRIGESFDDFLKDEGILDDVTAAALGRLTGKPSKRNG